MKIIKKTIPVLLALFYFAGTSAQDRVILRGRNAPAGVDDFPGIGGRNPPEWVDDLQRNQWTICAGIGGRFRPEYPRKPQSLWPQDESVPNTHE